MQNEMLTLDARTKSIVENYIPKEEVLGKMSEFFSIFSDATRLKIISALSISEMCVTDLGRVLSINQSTLSHQLKSLKTVGVIGSKRQGKIIFYFVVGGLASSVMSQGVSYLEQAI